VRDLLRTLSAPHRYPVRAHTAKAHQQLGLDEQSAARIGLYGSAGTTPLLELLIGDLDPSGKEVYVRRAGSDEARSAQDRFSGYAGESEKDWYELRLFPAGGKAPLSADRIQRVQVRHEGAVYTLARNSARRWLMEGVEDKTVDLQKAEAYLKTILEAEAEDIVSVDAAAAVEGSLITLELGDTSVLSIAIAAPDTAASATGVGAARKATVSNARYVYALADWTTERLLRERDYFFATSE